MTKQPTSDYQEVDRRFDEDFNDITKDGIIWGKDGATIVTVEGSQLKAIKHFWHSELDRVREEVIKECLEALPTECYHSKNCGSIEDVGEVGYCTCGAEYFNKAISLSQTAIKLAKDIKTR